MILKTLREQQGNSCAAHCMEISYAGMNNGKLGTAGYVEKYIWPQIHDRIYVKTPVFDLWDRWLYF